MTDRENAKPGKALVRELLLDRLTEAGLARRRGTSVQAHEVGMKRLAESLGYMTEDNLRTLAETIMDQAADGCWPPEIHIRQLAHALEAPPIAEARVVSSWLASVRGPEAQAEGWLVELYRFLRARRQPPQPWDARRLRAEAEDNARRLELLRERLERGAASAEDRGWLAAWERDSRAAEAVVARGRDRRVAQEQQTAGQGRVQDRAAQGQNEQETGR